MKRFRNILSSGSVSDEPSSLIVSQTKKMPKMDTGDGSGRQEEPPEEVSLMDVYVQLNIKLEKNSQSEPGCFNLQN